MTPMSQIFQDRNRGPGTERDPSLFHQQVLESFFSQLTVMFILGFNSRGGGRGGNENTGRQHRPRRIASSISSTSEEAFFATGSPLCANRRLHANESKEIVVGETAMAQGTRERERERECPRRMTIDRPIAKTNDIPLQAARRT